MKVLIVGSGGREHALAWKIAQSPRVRQLWVAPGNGGTGRMGPAGGNVPIPVDDVSGLCAFAKENRIDLTVVGPETPLTMGLADAFHAAGLPIFGPTRAAAQIESSKIFAKGFMRRQGIPTARYAAFIDYSEAVEHVHEVTYPVVVKASGLAAGKGVLLPDTPEEAEQALREIMLLRAFGEAGDQVVIEERLDGPEVSVLAFSDGHSVALLPPAQDHKRALDGDLGPNTGGMGAYAPAPIAHADLLDLVRRTVLQPAIDGLRVEGSPFVGVLYAGMMLTKNGPKALEFNCRLGDPETQALLPLLQTDLVEVLEACLSSRLDQVEMRWRPGAAATVVLTAAGYPGAYEKNKPISGLEQADGLSDAFIFHAGTRRLNDRIVSNGGRVLNVTGVGDDLPGAVQRAYNMIEHIHFEGMTFRRDIGYRALRAGGQTPE